MDFWTFIQKYFRDWSTLYLVLHVISVVGLTVLYFLTCIIFYIRLSVLVVDTFPYSPESLFLCHLYLAAYPYLFPLLPLPASLYVSAASPSPFKFFFLTQNPSSSSCSLCVTLHAPLASTQTHTQCWGETFVNRQRCRAVCQPSAH